MLSCPPSEYKKHVIKSHQCAENSAKALEALNQNALLPKNERKSVKSIAIMHNVHHATLYQCLKPGKQLIQEFNAEKGHLSPAQEDILVEWCLGLAGMALGLTPKLIQAYTHDIILQSVPDAAPPGKNWVSQFLM